MCVGEKICNRFSLIISELSLHMCACIVRLNRQYTIIIILLIHFCLFILNYFVFFSEINGIPESNNNNKLYSWLIDTSNWLHCTRNIVICLKGWLWVGGLPTADRAVWVWVDSRKHSLREENKIMRAINGE